MLPPSCPFVVPATMRASAPGSSSSATPPSATPYAVPPVAPVFVSREWAEFLIGRYAESTARSYRSHVNRLLKLGLTADFVGFARFLMMRPENVNGPTARSMFSAVRQHMLLQGVMPHPVEQALLRIALDRHNQESLVRGEGRTVRGVLTYKLLDMVRELPEAEVLEAFGSRSNVYGVFLQYTFALRVAEVGRLMTTSIQRSSNGEYFVTQRRAKAARGSALTARTAREIHYGSSKYAATVEHILSQIAPSEVPQPLLPGFDSVQVNAGLKTMARRLRWDPESKWTSHALRYGSLADAWSEAAAALVPKGEPIGNYVDAILDQVRRRSAHSSQDMAFWYTLTASERVEERDAIRRRVHERIVRADKAPRAVRVPTSRSNRLGALRLSGQRRARDDDDDDDSADDIDEL
jgi:hypothetical protein